MSFREVTRIDCDDRPGELAVVGVTIGEGLRPRDGGPDGQARQVVRVRFAELPLRAQLERGIHPLAHARRVGARIERFGGIRRSPL